MSAAAEQCQAAIKVALTAFPEPATQETIAARATIFVCALSGALGYHDAALGAAIFAVVQPPAAEITELEAA